MSTLDHEVESNAATPDTLSRRKLLAGGAALALAPLLAEAALAQAPELAVPPPPPTAPDLAVPPPSPTTAAAAEPFIPPLPPKVPSSTEEQMEIAEMASRSEQAYRKRLAAAAFQRRLRLAERIGNEDENAVPRLAAVYSKGMPHNRVGEVVPGAYAYLLEALRSGEPADFERIPTAGRVKLVNPQAALAFNLIGPDPAAIACPPAPRFSSAEQAFELAELYWQALARDVPFAEYESNPMIGRAAEELDRLSGRRGEAIKPRTVFRGDAAGCLNGPYISQFLLQDVPLQIAHRQQIRTSIAGVDYIDNFESWLEIQNGGTAGASAFEPTPHYIRNGRDLADWVHNDYAYQAALDAGLIMLKMSVPLNPGNPYKHSVSQSGFATLGPPNLVNLLALATQCSLTACWYQKWIVHRRLRPEEMAGRVENQRLGRAEYPLPAALLDSVALAETLKRQSTALLSSVYPEGCPTHPSYPAGHAVVAGACVSVLKAFFDERFVFPKAVVPTADGRSLVPYSGAPLTVGGELDKLAANIALGRDFAGIHWRSDSAEGMRLGEEVTISALRELKVANNETYAGFPFHRIDGRLITA
jgi:hypothetical protein